MDYGSDSQTMQEADRITQILQSKAAPSNAPPAMPAVMPQPVPAQQQMNITDILKKKVASGDPQATALDKRVKMFVGNDPTAYDSAVQFLNAHPDEIDPSNSFQTTTALAQWSKQSGYHKQAAAERQMPTNQQFAMQDLANIASGKGTDILGLQQDAEKNIATMNALDAKVSGGEGGGRSAFSQVMAQINSDPKLSQLPMMEKLRIAQNKVGTNLTVDPNTGQVIDMGGAAQGLGNLAYGEKYGGTTGDLTAQGQLKPGVEGAVENSKNASDAAYAEPKAAAAARGTAVGEVVGKAQADLGSIEDARNIVVQQVQGALKDPGKSKALGMWDANTPTWKGGDAYGFQQKVNQLNGAAFLDAYKQLRGGGAISDSEGPKATAAKSRMESAATEEQFDAAAKDFLDIVETGVKRARLQAEGKLGASSGSISSKTGGVLHKDAQGNKAIVYPDGSYEEVQ